MPAVAGWPVLLATTPRVLPWAPVVAADVAALALTALLAVLPPAGDGVLPGLAVLLLASGWAVVGEDAAALATPVSALRRLLARLVVVVPVSAAGLAGVLAVAALAGARTDAGLVLLWASLGVIAAATGAVARRSAADLPAPVAGVLVLGAGLITVTMLPPSVLELAPWDSAVEGVLWAFGLSAVALARATRDPSR